MIEEMRAIYYIDECAQFIVSKIIIIEISFTNISYNGAILAIETGASR